MFLERYPFVDGTIIDVGANLGLFAITLSKRFPNRRIMAFEPGGSTYAALTTNVRRNGAANIECHCSAVADFDGLVSFVNREDARANSALKAGRVETERSVMVPCTTLDSVIVDKGIDRISFLKIDVEGFEPLVLRGLTRLRPSVVLFEVCPPLARRAGFDAAAAARHFMDLGYRLARIRGEGDLSEASIESVYNTDLENWVAVDSQ